MEENEKTVENEEVVESDDLESSEEETVDWKERAQELERKAILQRAKTKELKMKLAEKSETSEKKDSKFGYGEKAYLRASGVPVTEYGFIEEIAQTTGEDIDTILSKKWVQSELKERSELKTSEESLPKSSKRPASSPKDSVDYWIQKGELPPERELRIKVVNERIKRETNNNIFTDTPIV